MLLANVLCLSIVMLMSLMMIQNERQLQMKMMKARLRGKEHWCGYSHGFVARWMVMMEALVMILSGGLAADESAVHHRGWTMIVVMVLMSEWLLPFADQMVWPLSSPFALMSCMRQCYDRRLNSFDGVGYDG